jgi:uncharacterized protein
MTSKTSNYQLFIITVLLVIPALGTVFGQKSATVTIDNSEEFILISNQVRDTLYVQVSLPLDYQNNKLSYPIIYVLDSDRTFGIATDISRWLTFGQEIPPSIIIGVTYKNNWWQKRSRDYTPTKDKVKNWGDWPLAGGADNFISSIKNEINSALAKYRVDWSNRTIIGLSFGGLFANYAMFKSPDTFDNYIIISPALIWDNKYLFTLNREILRANKTPIKIFTAIGTLDEEKIIEPWRQMNTLIQTEKFEKVSWTTKEYERQTHISVLPFAITDGLKNLMTINK